MNDSGVSCPPSTSMNPVQLFHEFLVTVNDPVTSLILGSSYRSNGKEDQWQIRLRVSWDTFSARSVFRLWCHWAPRLNTTSRKTHLTFVRGSPLGTIGRE